MDLEGQKGKELNNGVLINNGPLKSPLSRDSVTSLGPPESCMVVYAGLG
jgi:hypothetical protein